MEGDGGRWGECTPPWRMVLPAHVIFLRSWQTPYETMKPPHRALSERRRGGKMW